MQTRPLTDAEIAVLVRQNCSSASWGTVRVHSDFNPENTVCGTFFSGDVVLGVFDAPADGPSFPPPGVRHARLHNATVGDNCRIAHADIADTDIGPGCLVYKVDSISHSGESSFANGSPCHVVAEDGARSVPLWRNLSSQWAHLILHLKNTPAAERLEQIIRQDALALRSARSRIGAGCRIRFAGTLENVSLESGTVVEGAARLAGCAAVSSPAAPVFLGEGVAAEDCIFLQGSRTAGGARLEHSLIGEGVRIDHAFFAKHSLLFANSEFGLGEAACGMCGPFATSHHRSTLVLACQCSFANFGSGSNASNHHFKLGPRHGGVLRRGVRCGSGSYLFWPGDIGAFSTVVGRHPRHLDTTAFPFSLLTASGERSVLVPGVNLFSAGLFRDERKWPGRDRRAGIGRPRDLVNPAVMSPYVMQALLQGLALLRGHEREAEEGIDLPHGGAVIPAARVGIAIDLYENALLVYLGECLLRHVPGVPADDDAAVAAAVVDLLRREADGLDAPNDAEWRDWGGMLLPGGAAKAILSGIENGVLATAAAIDEALFSAHAGYAREELRWAAAYWLRRYGEASPETVAAFLASRRAACDARDRRRLEDAAKEFRDEVMFGFGVEDDTTRSFRRIRGEMNTDPTVAEMLPGPRDRAGMRRQDAEDARGEKLS